MKNISEKDDDKDKINSSYAILNLETEHPIIEAIGDKRGSGNVNGAYDEDGEEEGFEENKMNEPAGSHVSLYCTKC